MDTCVFNIASKLICIPGNDTTTKWVALARLSLTSPPPLQISSFILLIVSSNKVFQSGFLESDVSKRKELTINLYKMKI